MPLSALEELENTIREAFKKTNFFNFFFEGFPNSDVVILISINIKKSCCTHVQNSGLGDDCDWYSIGIVIFMCIYSCLLLTFNQQNK